VFRAACCSGLSRCRQLCIEIKLLLTPFQIMTIAYEMPRRIQRVASMHV
jgi:hypothetical protein